jgi:hypothetical protein
MKTLNRNKTINLIKSKKWWYDKFKNESKSVFRPGPDIFYFGIKSKKQN